MHYIALCDELAMYM